MKNNIKDPEIRKRIKAILLLATFFTSIIIILVVIAGFEHSWEFDDNFIISVLFSFIIIWVMTILNIPKVFSSDYPSRLSEKSQNLPEEDKLQRRIENMANDLTEIEIQKRLRIVFSVSALSTILLIILVILVGFTHSWDLVIDFIAVVIWAFTLIWTSTILAVPKCFQNLSIEKKVQQRFEVTDIFFIVIIVLSAINILFR